RLIEYLLITCNCPYYVTRRQLCTKPNRTSSTHINSLTYGRSDVTTTCQRYLSPFCMKYHPGKIYASANIYSFKSLRSLQFVSCYVCTGRPTKCIRFCRNKVNTRT